MTTTDSTDIEATQENHNVSPGAQLRKAREALGLSQKQVAERLHLRLSSIVAIEDDGIEPGVSITFTKGYVRLYARLVNLSAEPLLADFDKLHVKDQTPTKLQSFSHRVEREANDSRWNMVTYVVVFLVIACLGYWAYDQHDSSFSDFASEAAEQVRNSFDSVGEPIEDNTNSASEMSDIGTDEENLVADVNEPSFETPVDSDKISEESAQAMQLDTSGQSVSEDTDVQQVNSAETLPSPEENTNVTNSTEQGTSSDASGVVAGVESANEQNADDKSEVPDSTPPLEESINQSSEIDLGSLSNGVDYITNADGSVDMSFTFARDCWLSVRDSNGETIAIGTKVAGRVMNVSGVPPISVNLCPPERVGIIFGGRPVDLSEFNRGSPIKLELPLVSE